MVSRAWIRPTLRVVLPRSAFDAWRNYPELSVQIDNCPEEIAQAIDLYFSAMTGPWPVRRSEWWVHELDDPASELSHAVRTYVIDPSDPRPLPAAFRHPWRDEEIHPWIDYFAYWQVFQLADYVRAMTRVYTLTETSVDNSAEAANSRRRCIAWEHRRLAEKWEPRLRVFDWLSRMRTAMGASVSPMRSYQERALAWKHIAQSIALTPAQMKDDVRNTLLRMWWDAMNDRSRDQPLHEPLVHLLRQDIQYAIAYIEAVSGEAVDVLDSYWTHTPRHDRIAHLIDALPREEDLARREFPCNADVYLCKSRAAIPQIAHLDQSGLRQMLASHWQTNRALGRLVLAFYRFHRELRGTQLTEESGVVRQAERIEQFNLVAMNAERVLSHEYRKRRSEKTHPDVRKLVKDSLNFVLCRWQLTGAISLKAQAIVKALLQARSQLHALNETEGLPLVSMTEPNSGNAVVDHLIAGFVNLVIVRNYAAHHDELDFDLVYFTLDGKRPHPGGLALESILLAICCTLSVTGERGRE